MNEANVFRHLQQVARVSLGLYPTPIHEAPRLGEAIGGVNLYVKREDLSGLAFGGNKVRTLEYTMAAALEAGADCVVAAAYAHSNHCRQAAAAAARLGLEAYVLLRVGIQSDVWQGNMLLDQILGAHVELVEAPGLDEVRAIAEARCHALADEGRRPFQVTLTLTVRTLATVGALGGYLELRAQLRRLKIKPDFIYISSAGATLAGALLGVGLLGEHTRVVGVSAEGLAEERTALVSDLVDRAATRLDLPSPDLARVEWRIDDAFVAPAYGVTNPSAIDALHLAARTEGLLLDPVYTAKGLAGLTAHVRSGKVPPGSTVVFVHTGGTPNLFSYAEQIEPGLATHSGESARA
jgi:1-aminocyclopropane-1-carboxylate deaminase/D-cysteine desulfhydrase-like pyridoxal-dependent ACC family enzyme